MKLKTHKMSAKRFRITRKGKVIKRAVGQDHFNARESGNTTRNKRRDTLLSKSDTKNVKEFIPYSKF